MSSQICTRPKLNSCCLFMPNVLLSNASKVLGHITVVCKRTTRSRVFCYSRLKGHSHLPTDAVGYHHVNPPRHRSRNAFKPSPLCFQRLQTISFNVAQGRLTEAELQHTRALAIRENTLGSEHPDVATVLNNLAAYLPEQVTVVSLLMKTWG